MQGPFVYKARWLGAYLSDAVLKVRVLNVGFKPFALQGEAPSFEFPPNCVSLCRSELYGRTASQPLLLPLDVGFFSVVREGFT